MNELYPELEQIARELLQEFGQLATLTQQGEPRYNDATGEYETQNTTHQGWAAAFGYDLREINEHTIVQGDLKVYLERINVAPKVGDTLQINSNTWRVKNVQPLSPANFAVIYVLQVGL